MGVEARSWHFLPQGQASIKGREDSPTQRSLRSLSAPTALSLGVNPQTPNGIGSLAVLQCARWPTSLMASIKRQNGAARACRVADGYHPAVIPTPHTTTVGTGATVGYYEFGDPDGKPVIFLHGVPSCGAAFTFTDEPARARGIRVIAPDRPGVGLSSRAVGWSVSSYPDMLAELADALGIEQFALSGYSGGGPYSVAAAAKLPKRVRRLAVAAGMGQIGEWAEIADFEKTDRQFLAMARKQPRMARALLTVTARLARLAPKTAVKSFVKELSESDRRVLADMGPPTDAIALFTQAFLQGAGGVVDDYRALGQLWAVDPATINLPVMVLQGDADTMVPLRHSEELAKRIPGAELVVWPGEGHLGPIAHVGEILDFLNADVGR